VKSLANRCFQFENGLIFYKPPCGMKVLLLIFLCAVIFLSFKTSFKEKFYVNLRLQNSVQSNPIVIIVEVKNISNGPVSVSKNTTWDYKWTAPYYMGNYIVEIEKKENDNFKLFPPLSDIDPIYSEEAWIKLYPNEVLIDSMNISFFYSQQKLPEGDYRVRVAFNADRWSHSLENLSNWVNLTIAPDDSKY
jgi:hypothetical protein